MDEVFFSLFLDFLRPEGRRLHTNIAPEPRRRCPRYFQRSSVIMCRRAMRARVDIGPRMPEFWRRVGTTSPPLLGPLSAVLSAHMSSRATTAFSAPVDARARPQYTQCAAQDNVSPSMPSEVPTRRLLPCALMRRRDGRITSRGAAPRAPLTGDPAPLQPL